MNPVLRIVSVYLFLYFIFRVLGKRSLAEITTFDFVLLLIISETTSSAMIGEDFSITNALVIVASLVGVDYLLSLMKEKWKWFGKIGEGAPLVLVDRGKPLKVRMNKSKVDEKDVLEAARLHHGLERMDQIKYAVLERDGSISIIPYS